MAEIETRDVVTLGLERMISQWEEKPVIIGLFKSYLENIQSLEDMWIQLLNERDIYSSIGDQLDVLGVIVGEGRMGRDDDDYRQAILNRISINASDGTPPRALDILKLVTQANYVTLFEHYPAAVYYFTDGTTTDTTPITMDNSSAAGVKVRVMVDQGNTSFIPASLIASQNILGVDDDGLQPTPPSDTLGVNTGDEVGVASFITNPIGTRSYLPHTLDTAAAARLGDYFGTTQDLVNPLCAIL